MARHMGGGGGGGGGVCVWGGGGGGGGGGGVLTAVLFVEAVRNTRGHRCKHEAGCQTYTWGSPGRTNLVQCVPK